MISHSTIKKIIKYTVGGGVVFALETLALNAVGIQYGLGVIVTKSLEENFFIYTKNWHNKIAKGKIVYFHLPIQTPYYKKASKFAKFIRCEGEDRLSTQGLDYYCNGDYLGRAKTADKNGHPVIPFTYNGIMPKGRFFVMGTHPDSYDSRYWGFVREDQIKGIALWSI